MGNIWIASSRATAALLGIIALLVLMPTSSRAGAVSTVYTFDAQTLDGLQPTLSRDFAQSVAQFNPSLGTLNSIVVAFSMTITDNATSPLVGDAMEASGGASPVFNGQGLLGFSVNASATSTKSGPFSATDTEGSTETLIRGVTTSPTTFDGVIGTGTIPFDYPFTGIFDGNSELVDPSVTTSGSLNVTYDFSSSSAAVPMPSSLKTSLWGLVALGLFRLGKTAKDSFASGRVP